MKKIFKTPDYIAIIFSENCPREDPNFPRGGKKMSANGSKLSARKIPTVTKLFPRFFHRLLSCPHPLPLPDSCTVQEEVQRGGGGGQGVLPRQEAREPVQAPAGNKVLQGQV